MKKNLLFCAATALVFSFFSCVKNDTGCPYTELTIKAPASETLKVEQYLQSKSINAQKDSSGVYYTIETAGSGKTPEVCSIVTVNYTGALTTDSIFDRTTNSPVSFRLGDLIAGWQKGLPHIKAGGKLKLYVPPSLGYGGTDVTRKDQSGATVVIIPANSILVFNLELVGVQ